MKSKLVLLLFILLSIIVSGQQSKEVKDLEKKRAAVVAAIKKTQSLLNENKRNTGNVNTRIALLRDQINSRKNLIRLLDQEVTAITKDISAKEVEIKRLEKELESRKESYAKSIQHLYMKRNSSNDMLFVLSASDFNQALRRAVYLKEYSTSHKKQAEEIAETQQAVYSEKAALEQKKEEKIALLASRKEEEKNLVAEEAKINEERTFLQKEQKTIQADLNKKKKEEEALSKEIQRVIAAEIARAKREEEERLAREAKAATAAQGTKPTQGTKEPATMTQTKEDAALSANFGDNKGRLPLPIKGNYKIMNSFGVSSRNPHPGMDYKGLNILTTAGNDAVSVFDGTVLTVGKMGKTNEIYILIKHGQYYTFYKNFETVYVKKGDKVKKGQSLGRVYTDTLKDGTVLYFQLLKGEQLLNPEPWLLK
jgi:Membrane-bound metallopeptidase